MIVIWVVHEFIFQAGSLGSFSSDIYRLLHLCDEEDDATSGLAAPKPEPDAPKVGGSAGFQEVIVCVALILDTWIGQYNHTHEVLCSIKFLVSETYLHNFALLFIPYSFIGKF